jgi:hypothetical protein
MLAAGTLLAGCSAYDYKYDFDTEANFAAYKTYAWIPITINQGATTARAALRSNTLLDKRIRTNVEAQLAAKGFTKVEENPDVLVVYHTGVQNKVDVTDWGYTYSGSYWGWAGRDIDVYSYTEGTLIIDMVEAADKQLVWRGAATGVVEPGSPPEKLEQRIQEVIAGIFANYPPVRR